MRLVVVGAGHAAPKQVERLARRIVSPLCGLDTQIGFVLPGRGEPRCVVAGATLTGVHRQIGGEPGSYHIGGTGLTRHEALVRAVGETVERHAQLTACAAGLVPVEFTTASALRAAGHDVLDPADLAWYSTEQYAAPGFPFQPPAPDAGYGWVSARVSPGGSVLRIPAQLVLVGYHRHAHAGEAWLTAAVTTGTATHRTRQAAARSALLELIQVDAAMGHWYGDRVAPRIRLGGRLGVVARIVSRHVPPGRASVSFHHLAAPGFGVPVVACVLRSPPPRLPAAVVGLGCDLTAAGACYKALLEAIGVWHLAKLGLAGAGPPPAPVAVGPGIFDLDSNVTHYARSHDDDTLAAKFPADDVIGSQDLPADPPNAGPQSLVAAFAATGLRLVEMDLTTGEGQELGLVTQRWWSPDLLPLAMPSAPARAHPRAHVYGGFRHDRPHPYP
jgi:thiazole/oxazole-forming peptide maturase SagD family component